MEQLDDNALNVYTDGSSYSGPRRGGIGIVFVTVGDDGHEVRDPVELPGFAAANSQQMEIQAVIEALEAILRGLSPYDPTRHRKIIFYTDSTYVVDGYPRAQSTWPRGGWVTRDGIPVANVEQWKKLVKLAQRTRTRVAIQRVPGHKHSVPNKEADKLAKRSAKGPLKQPLSIVKVRRKKTTKSLERGSVKLTSQRLTIRIVTDEYLPSHRLSKYRYEVMSKSSPYFRNVDLAFSDQVLSAGHTYRVRMGEDTSNPRIAKVFQEVT